jgi:hypothetical protein
MSTASGRRRRLRAPTDGRSTERGVAVVKETALFVGWGRVYPGREQLALEKYHEWITLLEELKAEGEIEDFLTVTLAPHGGELDGFTLVFADPVKLMEITGRADMHKLQLLAEREFAKFSMIPCAVGEKVEKEFKLLEEEILPILERPVTV